MAIPAFLATAFAPFFGVVNVSVSAVEGLIKFSGEAMLANNFWIGNLAETYHVASRLALISFLTTTTCAAKALLGGGD